MEHNDSHEHQSELDLSAILDQAAQQQEQRRTEHMDKQRKPRTKLLMAVCAAVVVLAVGGTCVGMLMGREKPTETDNMGEMTPVFTTPADTTAQGTTEATSADKTTTTTASDGTRLPLVEGEQSPDTPVFSGDTETDKAEREAFVYLKNGGLWYRDTEQGSPICLTEKFFRDTPTDGLAAEQLGDMEMMDWVEMQVSKWVTVLPDRSGIIYPTMVDPFIEVVQNPQKSFNTTVVYRSLKNPSEPLRLMDQDVWDYQVLQNQTGVIYKKLIRNGGAMRYQLFWTDFRTKKKLTDDFVWYTLSESGNRLLIGKEDISCEVRELSPDGTLSAAALFEHDFGTICSYNKDFSEFIYEDHGFYRWREGEGTELLTDISHPTFVQFCGEDKFYWTSETEVRRKDGKVVIEHKNHPGEYVDLVETHLDPDAEPSLFFETFSLIDIVDDPMKEYDDTRTKDDPDWEQVKLRNKIRRELRNLEVQNGYGNCLWYFDGEKHYLLSETMYDVWWNEGSQELFFQEQSLTGKKLKMSDLEKHLRGLSSDDLWVVLRELTGEHIGTASEAMQLVQTDGTSRKVIGGAGLLAPGIVLPQGEAAIKEGKLTMFERTGEGYILRHYNDFGRKLVEECTVTGDVFNINRQAVDISGTSGVMFTSYYADWDEFYKTVIKDKETASLRYGGKTLFDYFSPTGREHNRTFIERVDGDAFLYFKDARIFNDGNCRGELWRYDDGKENKLSSDVLKFGSTFSGAEYYIVSADSRKKGSLYYLNPAGEAILLDEGVEFVLGSDADVNLTVYSNGIVYFETVG